MSEFIDGLEQDLVAAARRLADARSLPTAVPGPANRRRRRWGGGFTLRTVLVALLLAGTAATAGAAATLVALRGSVIPAPAAVDVPREQTPVPDTVRVSALRVADPDRRADPWTIRVARSATGYLCSTVGQVSGGRFGLVGLDGRFRELPPGLTDSCGQERSDGPSLLGARVFAGRTGRDVRTVVNGVGGTDLRRVEIAAGGRTVRAQVAAGGAFVAVLRGYPEDLQLEATLIDTDGRRRTEDLGRNPALTPDPDGGPAWRPQGLMTSGDARQCSSFTWARRLARQPQSPTVCGLLVAKGQDARSGRGVYFAVRRLTGRRHGQPFRPGPDPGDWHDRPARTAVWGGAGRDVADVTVLGAAGGPRRVSVSRRTGGQFLVVLPGAVDPAALRVRVRYRDGRSTTSRGDVGLVERSVPATLSGRRK